MADSAQIGSADPPVAPPSPLVSFPLQLNGNSELATPVPNSSDGGSATLERYPQSNGVTVKKSANRKLETLRISEDNFRRRSPRLAENAAGERSPMDVNSLKLSGPDDIYPRLKKHKGGKHASFFVGEPVPDDEARRRWTWRYEEAEVCAAVMWFEFLAEVFLHDYELLQNVAELDYVVMRSLMTSLWQIW